MRFLPQAYLSVKPANMGGFQFDFGKFYTSAGAEVTETHLNWNYSRSLLYANGPYYHMGVRTSKPITKWFTAGFQVVNGWNNVEDNNSGKTVGFTTAMTSKKVSWLNTYMVGPEKTQGEKGVRHFWDTVLNLTADDRNSFYINFNYGDEKNPRKLDSTFWGIAGAYKAQFNDRWSLSERIEYYKDTSGLITGKPQALKEFTVTGEYRMKEGFLMRAEYRHDWSDQRFFDRGAQMGNAKHMHTLLAGFVVYFGPKR